MIRDAVILPTGDEIADGTVVDIDSPMVMREIVRHYPRCRVLRAPPLRDCEEEIVGAVREHAGAGLLVLIGGSGGGREFAPGLGEDRTRVALEMVLDEYAGRSVYGKNGHLWSRLFCGRLGESTVINLPGPYVEAKAVIRAYMHNREAAKNHEWLVEQMTNALLAQYGGAP